MTLAILIPTLPLAAAGSAAFLRRGRRHLAAGIAITAQALAFVSALGVFLGALDPHAGPQVLNFPWLQLESETIRLGLLVDPLSAGMALMVTFVSLLIFIYSVGYMANDPNATRFFCFLSLFSAAMLGVVLSNSLLLTFICWELVGLASYLLIGFWFQKPAAAAAAKKAFLTTRIGDLGFFLGLLWLSHSAGTLLFYDNGNGCLEGPALTTLATQTTLAGLALSNAIALLIFCGAAGKSGQFPLHVWLPDAMEGPTPVSALIHAATMVAAGVFLIARLFPLFSAAGETSTALTTVAWIGAFTALFAAIIAVAQNDIKRILAFSTISQLGFMMLALGVGSVGAAMAHLIAHAFFKALLFLGAGSVIHGAHDEQDIRKLGGLRRYQPVTFVTYAIGMMALAGVPVVFSGFWSKDEILHAAHGWPVSHGPFFLAAAAAFLTAFYMTRQMAFVFFGKFRGDGHPHESPAIMTIPLAILAFVVVALSLPLTPAWPWLHGFHSGHLVEWDFSRLVDQSFLTIAGLSVVLGGAGIALAAFLYRGTPSDPLDRILPRAVANRFFVDEIYRATILRAFFGLGSLAAAIECALLTAANQCASGAGLALAKTSAAIDRLGINLGFDSICGGLQDGGDLLSSTQNGRTPFALRWTIGALIVLLVAIGWIFS